MKLNAKKVGLALLCGGALAALACGAAGGSTAPITVAKTDAGEISYAGTVQPILTDHCQRCHAEERKGNLDLMTYDGVMKGGNKGPIVKPGAPDESLLVGSVEKRMLPNMPPRVFPALTPDRIQAIRQWISEGAKNN